MYQTVACGLLSLLALLAVRNLRWASGAGLAIVGVLLLINQNTYAGLVWVPIAASILFVLGLQLGYQSQHPDDNVRIHLPAVLVGVMLGAVINSFMGLLQYLGLAGQLWPWVPESLQRGVAFGIFRQTNLFATLLCCGLACTVFLAQHKKITVSMAWLIVAILHLGLAASGSRIGVVQAVAVSQGARFKAVQLRQKRQKPRGQRQHCQLAHQQTRDNRRLLSMPQQAH